MPVTKAEALVAQRFHRTGPYGRPCEGRLGPEVWRRNGKTQTWVRSPERFEVPVKFGMYSYGHITQTNADQYHIEQECTAPSEQVSEVYRNHLIGCDFPYEHPGGCIPAWDLMEVAR